MDIFKAFKTELNPNAEQLTLFKKSAGAARWAYNWGLSKKTDAFKNKEKLPSAMDLHKKLVCLKKTEIPWMYKTSKCAPYEALRNLDKAFDNFFRNCKKKKNGKKGFPRFKSKHKNNDSFRLYGSIHVLSDRIQLPRIGIVRLKERNYIPTDNAKIFSATISKQEGFLGVIAA
ncbi:MAG: helix-turn-helix domain-containing protein [Candidatus Kuenenia sp.]|nr:helix-turn-helix domain-containing protein [Candidatus Kuenenia sp.]